MAIKRSLQEMIASLLVLLTIITNLNASIIPADSYSDLSDDTEQVDYSVRYNEDADLSPRELIKKYGYRGETHRVSTHDGYILEMHRITGPKSNPKPDGKPVIFLMHGLLSSSVDWLISGPDKAFAYLLANDGYDVWLGNARGNHYSRRHKKYSVLDQKFWTFSWHEIGYYDLPAMIDYVTNNTKNEKIFYAGHSQGTTSFFVMTSERPEYNDKIKAMFALAPIVYLKHMTSPFFQVLSRYQDLVIGAMTALGLYEFQPTDDFLNQVKSIICSEEAWTQPICENTLFLLGGFGSDQMNRTLLPAILGHIPAGSSTRQIIHYGQLIKSNKFRQFDHGFIGNMLKYRRASPPAYDLSKVKVPVILHYSVNDWLAHVKDVNRLEKELGNVYAKLKVPNPRFGHLDYTWGVDAYQLLYSKTITMMGRFKNHN